MKKLIVSDLKLNIETPESDLIRVLAEKGIKASGPDDIDILKKSLDARDKTQLRYVYTLALNPDTRVLNKKAGILSYRDIKTYIPPKSGHREAIGRHVIIGTGPAGMFAGLLLAKAGYKPLLIERGEAADDRVKTVDRFWKSGQLDTQSNVCFGEGGAGTFSDGKLNTGIKDPDGRIRYVLETFAAKGADRSISYLNKPHVGSDSLLCVVKNIRKEILSLGGQYLFSTRLVDFESKKDGIMLTLTDKDGPHFVLAQSVILACGHSADDIYELMKAKGAQVVPKAFAVGLRIQHPQDDIQIAQYGTKERTYLPAADYKLSHRSKNGRGVYTFCMCPGGQVVNSSSENGRLCINGMSLSKRSGINANSAVVVTVNPSDFATGSWRGGIDFQRELEKNAYNIRGGSIPMQLYGDYKKGACSKAFVEVMPDVKGSCGFGRLNGIFSEEINGSLIEGIDAFGKSIKGFDRYDAILAGVESRTSAPVRILRNECFESDISGIFPCGEGAGYAGGITSAAVDGMKVAEEIIRRYKPC